MKYAPGGAELWAARYDSPAGRDDLPTSLAVDAAGNVFVTGASATLATNSDVTTIKYDTHGAQQWVATFDCATHHLNDYANAIALTPSGDVVVAGSTESMTGSDVRPDVLVLKYDGATGQERWAARYDGGTTGGDAVLSVAVDAAGDVFAAGFEGGAAGGNDFFVGKFAGTDGALQWRSHAGGPEFDIAQRVVVDSAGNPVVTGYSRGLSGAADRILTAKFDGRNGAELWQAGFRGNGGSSHAGWDAALDAADNVYVAGLFQTTPGKFDGCVVKYSSTGPELWHRLFSAGPGGQVFLSSVAVAPDGNPIVAGMTYRGGGFDIFIAGCEAAGGAVLWEAFHDQPSDDDTVREGFPFHDQLALAPNGDVIVTGATLTGAHYDLLALRYGVRANGPPSGGSLLHAPGPQPVAGREMFLTASGWTDADGDVPLRYEFFRDAHSLAPRGEVGLLRFTAPPAGDYTFTVEVTDARGLSTRRSVSVTVVEPPEGAPVLRWVATQGVLGGAGRVVEAGEDRDGNILVAATRQNTGGDYDFVVWKYDAAGALLWEGVYDSGGGRDDFAAALLLDFQNNVIVAGRSETASQDVGRVVKFSPGGALIWSAQTEPHMILPGREAQGPQPVHVVVSDAAVTGAGNVAVVLEMLGPSGFTGMATAKFAAFDGRLLWSQFAATGSGSGVNVDARVAVDDGGNVFIAGTLDGGNYTMARHHGVTGAVEWSAQYPAHPLAQERVKAAALDSAGNLVVAGTTSASVGGAVNSFLLKYHGATGIAVWTNPAAASESLHCLALDAVGNAITGGHTTTGGSSARKFPADGGAPMWGTELSQSGQAVASVALDRAGSPVLAGTTGGGRFFIEKRAASGGARLWTREYHDGTATYAVMAGRQHLVLTRDGGVLIAGGMGSFTSQHAVVAKFGPNTAPAGGMLVTTAPGDTQARTTFNAGDAAQASAPGWSDAESDTPLSYEFLLDGAPLAPAGLADNAVFTAPSAGSHVIELCVRDRFGATTSALATFATLNPANTLAAWTSAQNFPDAASADPLADPDGDGMPNLSEAAFGTDPQRADGRVVTGALIERNGSTRLALSYTRPGPATRLSDILYIHQASPDLTSWSTTGLIEEVSPVDAAGNETVTVWENSGPARHGFLRVQVRSSP